MQQKIILVAGARPNFMKIAPLVRALEDYNLRNENRPVPFRLVHTGQHYDQRMSASFFQDLNIPKPDVHLGVGSGTHGEQTGKILISFEKVLMREKPTHVVVVGDVNSTLACALAAAKRHVSVAHVEAGLRSFDPAMPEEINRILTDHISDLLFTTCEDGNLNLKREGISGDKIFFVGNVMIDSLMGGLESARKTDFARRHKKNLGGRPYALVTLHRPSNVDHPEVLRGILQALRDISKHIPVFFPAHPRTLKRIEEFEMSGLVKSQEIFDSSLSSGVMMTPPFSYLEFLFMMSEAAVVLTDSGGIQEETTILGIPCLTLRNNTERPITITQGTNHLVGSHYNAILLEARKVMGANAKPMKKPKYWDGRAAQRIVEFLVDIF